MKIRNLLVSTLTLSSLVIALEMSNSTAHTKCKQSLPFGGWTERCPHIHGNETPKIPGGYTGYKTNKFDKKAEIEPLNSGWVVIWGDDLSETDVASGVVAAGVSIYSGNSAAFIAWVEYLIDKTIYKISTNVPSAIEREASRLAQDVIYRAIRGESAREISRRYDTVDFKAGAIKYSGGNYAGGVKVSTTWGMKPYVAFRVRSSRNTRNNNSNNRGISSNSYALVCIENKSNGNLSMRYRWGDGDWKNQILEPRDIKWYSWKYASGSQSSPVFQVRFDSSYDEGTQWKTYTLKRFAVKSQDCNSLSDEEVHVFKNTNSRTVELYRGR